MPSLVKPVLLARVEHYVAARQHAAQRQGTPRALEHSSHPQTGGCNGTSGAVRAPGRQLPSLPRAGRVPQGSGQLHISDAMCGIRLNGPIFGAAGFVVAVAEQMTHRLCIEGGESPWVEWAWPYASFAPLDGPLWSCSRPCQARPWHAVRRCRSPAAPLPSARVEPHRQRPRLEHDPPATRRRASTRAAARGSG